MLSSISIRLNSLILNILAPFELLYSVDYKPLSSKHFSKLLILQSSLVFSSIDELELLPIETLLLILILQTSVPR